MLLIGSEHGATILFKDKAQIDHLIKRLTELSKWIDAEGIQPPYLHFYGRTEEPAETRFQMADQFTDDIKKAFTGVDYVTYDPTKTPIKYSDSQ